MLLYIWRQKKKHQPEGSDFCVLLRDTTWFLAGELNVQNAPWMCKRKYNIAMVHGILFYNWKMRELKNIRENLEDHKQ